MRTSAKDFFSVQDQEAIKQAIVNAELETSGEIRVHIEYSFDGEILDRASSIFSFLGMKKTKHRNGVLIYIATYNRLFAILGDSGINNAVPEHFWDDIRNGMSARFKEGQFTEGLTEAITLTGHQLKKYFPHIKGDKNELPDDLSFGND